MRKIQYTNRELCWSFYTVEWTEEDFIHLKEWLAKPTPSKWCEIRNQTALSVLSKLTWDEVIDEWELFRNDAENQLMIHFPSKYNMPDCSVGEFIEEFINEDAWNAAPEYGDRVDFENDYQICGTRDDDDDKGE